MTEIHVFCVLSSIFLTVVQSSIAISCPESIPTVSHVLKCPSDENEWSLAAKRKSCHDLAKVQNCTPAENFFYHCVLNKKATKLLEVCAPVWYMAGYCARFSIADQRIVNEPGLDCTKFVEACPSRFKSNESYKYQTCYKNIGDEKEVLNSVQCEKNDCSITGSIFAGFFVIIIVVIILLLFFCYQKKWILIRKLEKCREENDEEENVLEVNDEEENTEKSLIPSKDQKEDVEEMNIQENEEKDILILKRSSETEDIAEDDEQTEAEITIERPELPRNDDEEKMEFETMTGRTGTCSVKGVTDISMLREKLSEKLQFPKEIVWVVVKEGCIIYNDETEFGALKKHQNVIQLVIGNNNRIVHEVCNDSNVETDAISSKPLTSKKCRMSCNHFTAPETLFEYTKDKLTSGEAVVTCPKCNSKWEMSEIVQKSDMSRDEKVFLEHLMSLNLMTKMQFQTTFK